MYHIATQALHTQRQAVISPLSYPLERNGGDAHERYERFFIASYRVGNSFTKEITAQSPQT